MTTTDTAHATAGLLDRKDPTMPSIPVPIRLGLVLALGVLALLALASPALAAPQLDVEVARDQASLNRGDEFVSYTVTVSNIGPDATSGTTTLAAEFPAGMKFLWGQGSDWSCHNSAHACTISGAVAAGEAFPALKVTAWIYPDAAPDTVVSKFVAYGGGASGELGDAIGVDSFTFGPRTPFDIANLTAGAFDSLGGDYTQAGGHPFRAVSSLGFPTRMSPVGALVAIEHLRNVFFDLPAGFVGNPQASEMCTAAEVSVGACSKGAVGGIALAFAEKNPTSAPPGSPPGYPEVSVPTIYRVVPEDGYPAAFAFRAEPQGQLTFVLRPKLRSNGDYGITVVSPMAPQNPQLIDVPHATLCSYGARTALGGGIFDGCKQPGDPGAFEVPFVTNPTECAAAPPLVKASVDSYQHVGAQTADGFPDFSDPNWKTKEVVTPAMTGCDQVPFDPEMTIAPTSTGADSASGLDVDLDVPQDGLLSHTGIATAHLKKTVVQLSEGMSVNPSAATGLKGCSDEQVAIHRLTPPNCPEASRIGSVEVTSPLVDQPLKGAMFLATPKSTDPASGEMLRLFLAVRNDVLGVSAKLPGSTVADPETGRLTATFDQNPRVPFDHLEVHLKGGSRGVLSMPQECGSKNVESTLSPWTGTEPVAADTPFDVAGDCSLGFSPRLAAGMDNRAGRGTGTFSFEFSREDGEQWIDGLTATLPQGLLASVKDLPLCSDGQAEAGACPAGSRIGTVDSTAGTGDPFVLERKGTAYLTEGYKGCPYGLAVVVPVVAGPFDASSPETDLGQIVVRQKVCVDRSTAQVSAISDPFPTIWHGIPLRVRSVTVKVDRPDFMLNPSDCAQKQIGALLHSTKDSTAQAGSPFQASACASLAFRPKLTLALTGKKQTKTGKHPGIKAKVTQQGVSEAGIEKAVVRLPKSLALDVNNAGALCEFVDGTKPDLENYCPKGSIVGRARAKTPLLNEDLVGNVYFVKNIRIDKETGNQIRTLPMIIVALRGEISVNLRGESDTTKSGKLVNTFDNVPDAPISQFNLNIKGGNTGILAVTRTRRSLINICAGRHTAEADMDGHNGRRHDRDIRMKTPCTKKQTKAAKRQAKRAAKVRKAKRG
jgi:hypothetical protein